MATTDKQDIHQVLQKLQELVGATPTIQVSEFSNWASTQVRHEILAVSPTTVQEVQAVVRAARQLGVRVRAAGQTHTWTPLFSDEGDIVMYVGDLKRPDGPRLELITDPQDANSKYVTMATGVTTGELMEFQLSHSVSVPANVILQVVQMGGVVAPACHGVGWDVKSVSDMVVRMRIIDSNGDLRTYSLTEDNDMMRAVQANLGLWGIIVDLTLKVEPMILVETKNVWMKLKDIFYNTETLQKIVTENWSVEIFWFPFNGVSNWEGFKDFWKHKIPLGHWDPKEDQVWLRLINKANVVAEVTTDTRYKFLDFQSWIESHGFKVAKEFITKWPQCAPLFLHNGTNMLKGMFKGTEYQQLPHVVHYRGSIQQVPVYDMEWAVPVDKDFSNISTAIQYVIDLVYKDAAEGHFPLNLPLEMRFMADSDAYMAPYGGANPAYGGTGHTCCIEVLTVAHTPGWEEFCRKVAEVWQTTPGARPHWCKGWDFLPDIEDYIQKSYAQAIPRYLKALERSGADPDGIFFNDRLEKILYPDGHPAAQRGILGRAKKRAMGMVNFMKDKVEALPKPALWKWK